MIVDAADIPSPLIIVRPGDLCFRCGDPNDRLKIPYVVWNGTDQIGLHPRCATLLGANLVADGMRVLEESKDA